MVQVLLKPHIGISISRKKEVDLQQDLIFCDGEHVGYVGRKATSPICLTEHGLPEAKKDAIQAAVKAKFGGEPVKVAEPMALPEGFGEDETDEDE
jgi:hypothetical protein